MRNVIVSNPSSHNDNKCTDKYNEWRDGNSANAGKSMSDFIEEASPACSAEIYPTEHIDNQIENDEEYTQGIKPKAGLPDAHQRMLELLRRYQEIMRLKRQAALEQARRRAAAAKLAAAKKARGTKNPKQGRPKGKWVKTKTNKRRRG